MKKNIEIVRNIQKLFGTRDENLQVMEDGLKVNIELKADSVQIEGAAQDVARAEQIFADCPRRTAKRSIGSSWPARRWKPASV